MSVESEGRARAEAFRKEHHLGAQPVADLFALFELVRGLDVASIEVANPDEHGMTAHDPTRSVTKVVVACTPNPMRQRSTLAHELAHVLFGDYAHAPQGAWADSNPVETRATAFARHLLVPLDGLAEFLGERRPLALADLSRAVQWFQASPRIVLIQMQNAGYLKTPQKNEWWDHSAPWLAGNFGWTPQYRALQVESETPRAPQGLLARATRAYQEGILSLQAVARIRAATPDIVEEEFADAGISQAHPEIVWGNPDDLPRREDDFADLDALDGQAIAVPTRDDDEQEDEGEQVDEGDRQAPE